MKNNYKISSLLVPLLLPVLLLDPAIIFSSAFVVVPSTTVTVRKRHGGCIGGLPTTPTMPSLLFNPITKTSTGANRLPSCSKRSSSSSSSSSSSRLLASLSSLFGFGGIELAETVYDATSTAFDAWEWTNAIGAPAALVAGAVLVTLTETRESSAPRRTDSKRTRVLKLSMRFLLLTSFALEVLSIFVAVITGGVLLGHGEQKVVKKMIGYGAPLQLMHYHHEYVNQGGVSTFVYVHVYICIIICKIFETILIHSHPIFVCNIHFSEKKKKIRIFGNTNLFPPGTVELVSSRGCRTVSAQRW